VAVWYEENRKEIAAKVEAAKAEAVAFEVVTTLQRDMDAGLKGVAQVLGMLPAEEREAALKKLMKA
jgi:acetyl-CoA carboxylase / biotin carboxylase 1